MTDEKQISNDRILLNKKNEALKEREIFTDKEASDYLRISQVTLWRERKAGKITFRRVSSKIVYLREDLEAYLNRNMRNAFGINRDSQ
jgi:hypothetical protein